jgi:acetyltransferase-like isoleucine patch superfamily enzyme
MRASRLALDAYRKGLVARDKAFSLAVGGAFGSFGRRTVVQLPVRLSGERHMHLGDEVFVGAGSWLQVLESPAGAGALRIGDGTAISGSVVLSSAASIAVGRRVLIARGVYVGDHRHAFEDRSRPVMDQGLADLAPVRIEDGAWLGENVVVCPGVVIGAGAVIGANSVVTRSVPAHVVAAGAPARVLRTLAPAAAA